jgi:hypothetical protein
MTLDEWKQLPVTAEDLTSGLCCCGAPTYKPVDGKPNTCGYDFELSGDETPCNCCQQCARACYENV